MWRNSAVLAALTIIAAATAVSGEDSAAAGMCSVQGASCGTREEDWGASSGRTALFRHLPVREVVWPEEGADQAYLESLLEDRTPFVVRNGPAASWPAVKGAWTRARLQGALPRLPHVCSNEARKFIYYDSARPLAQVRTFRPPYSCHEMRTTSFFDALDEGEPVYFSNRLSEISEELLDDVQPLEPLIAPGKDAKSSLNFWLGAANTTALAHFDASHNLFVQVAGSKRFYLLPPTDWAAMALFPDSHPASRQCQLADLDAFSPDTFPMFNNVTLREVVLSAGDMLYLPPFEFHQVHAMADSISINIYRPADEVLLAQSVHTYQLPLQLSEERKRSRRQTAVALFLRQLLRYAFGDDAAAGRAFLLRALDSRFGRMHIDDDPCLVSRHTLFNDWQEKGLPCNKKVLSSEDKLELRAAAKHVGSMIAQQRPGVLEITLMDYIEAKTVQEAAVHPSNLPRFLRTCIAR